MATGRIFNLGDATSDYDAISRIFADSRYLQLAGTSAMTGSLDMGSFKIQNLANPTTSTDALNLTYADSRYVRVSGSTMTDNLQFSIPAAGSESKGLYWSGNTDYAGIFCETTGTETTGLKFRIGDNAGQDYFMFISVSTNVLRIDSNNISPYVPIALTGSAQNQIVFNNNKYVAHKTSSGETTRTLGVSSSNILYLGGIDNLSTDITQINFRTHGTDRALLNSSNFYVYGDGTTSDVYVKRSGVDKRLVNYDELLASAPVGAVIAYPASSVPTGWLECDGSVLSTATYADLYSIVGTIYGTGGGGTFKVPDLRGEFIRGWDHGRGVDSGRSIGTSQSDKMHSHNHQWYEEDDNGSTGRIDATASGGGASTFDSTAGASAIGNTELYSDRYTNTQNEIGSDETRPRNVSMMHIIKY
jgi:microcystin-dependent protein